MNKLLKYVAYGIGAFVLFVGSFLAFAAFSGAPMNELSVVGKFFPEPPQETQESETPTDPTEELERDTRPAEVVVEEAALPLHAFVLESSVPASELARLQSQLKALLRSNELRSQELDQREHDLEMRAQHQEERWAELESIRSNLMRSELELEQRQTDFVRSEAEQVAREKESWRSLAQIFVEGKAKTLVSRLTQYEPHNAAKILRALPDARAAELLAEVPSDRYIEYTEAYRKAED